MKGTGIKHREDKSENIITIKNLENQLINTIRKQKHVANFDCGQIRKLCVFGKVKMALKQRMNQAKMKTNQISQVSESAENVMINVQIDGAYENT